MARQMPAFRQGENNLRYLGQDVECLDATPFPLPAIIAGWRRPISVTDCQVLRRDPAPTPKPVITRPILLADSPLTA